MRLGTFTFVVSCFVVSCDSSETGKDRQQGLICDGASCSPAAAGLSGTWEIIGSRVGDNPRSALVAISSRSLLVSGWEGTFQAVAHGNAFDVAFNRTYPGGFGFTSSGLRFGFTATRTDGPGNAGIIPLPLFGEWDAHAQNSPGCTISARPDLATASCTRAGELPVWMQRAGAATLQATRTSALASEFGDFGGEWTFTTALGASCSIRVEGSTISAECTNAGSATGSGSLVFEGDSAHGSTSAGIEFTAQRL
jgi:hypothetical protein